MEVLSTLPSEPRTCFRRLDAMPLMFLSQQGAVVQDVTGQKRHAPHHRSYTTFNPYEPRFPALYNSC